jgi:hypothetical protein
MKLINRHTLAAEAYERLLSDSPIDSGNWRQNTERALKDLGPNPTPEQVEAVWPTGLLVPECTECGQNVSEVVQLGEPPDWESRTVYLCAKCLLGAMCLINP